MSFFSNIFDKSRFKHIMPTFFAFFDEKAAKRKIRYKKDDEINEKPEVPNSYFEDRDAKGYWKSDIEKFRKNYRKLNKIDKVIKAWQDYEENPLIWGVVQQQGFSVTLKNEKGSYFDEFSVQIGNKDYGQEYLKEFFEKTYLYKFMDSEVSNSFPDGTRHFLFVQDKNTKELCDIAYFEGIKHGKVIEPYYPFPNAHDSVKRNALYWVQSDLDTREIIRVVPDTLTGRITAYTKGGVVGDTMLEALHLGSVNQTNALEDMINIRPRMYPKIGITINTEGHNQDYYEAIARHIEEKLIDEPNKYSVITNGDVKTITPNIRNLSDMEHNRWTDQRILAAMHIPQGNIAGFAKDINRDVLRQQAKNHYDGIISSLRDRIDAELIVPSIKAWLFWNKNFTKEQISKVKIDIKWTDKLMEYKEYNLEKEKLELQKRETELKYGLELYSLDRESTTKEIYDKIKVQQVI